MASASLLAAATFCACDKDEKKDGNSGFSAIPAGDYTVKVENDSIYNNQVDTVRLIINSNCYVSAAKYADGGFIIYLPKNVADSCLEAIGEMGAGVTVSDPKVKVRRAKLIAYKLGADGGDFYHGTGGGSDAEWVGSLIYASGDVTITGTFTDAGKSKVEKYSVKLKKGWNIQYKKETEDENSEEEVYTTQAPADAKWYFLPNIVHS
ncbi:MAG: hypothetical protein LBT94_01290 [Prevotellaceae bacterium]|nr:hypothetical protein [Prevotellaceae bacterium]